MLYLHSEAGTTPGRLEIVHAGGAALGGMTIMGAALAEYLLVEDIPKGSHLFQIRQWILGISRAKGVNVPESVAIE